MSVDIAGFHKIAEGNDSHVYVDGTEAYKKFLRLPVSEIERYVELLDRSAVVIGQSGFSPVIGFFDRKWKIDFSVVPVREVVRDREGCGVTIAPYVSWPNLDKLTQRPDLYLPFSEGLGLPSNEAAFLSDLNLLFYEELPTRTIDEFLYNIDILSRILDGALGTFGIYIGKYNAKIKPDLEQSRLTFIITDLCVYMERLQYEREIR